ncbi:uncharacterized protein IL334_002148 [Kwoniella shivajii]|uniref:F-box domain-containing protein n=1 Tax=Kwoniella shivajii TaxID=564305 RepID=A0ABZ1CU85_9TREE|nr:hypothetical protein IL334_002148 [Kwoniella shivajii]
MDITLLPPSHILTHHSHLALLPSALPLDSANSSHHPQQQGRERVRSHQRRTINHYLPLPPKDGSSPFSSLPTEIILIILSQLDLMTLLSLRSVSNRSNGLVLTPALHRELTLHHIPVPLPTLLKENILPSIRKLNLHVFPYPTISPRLDISLVHGNRYGYGYGFGSGFGLGGKRKKIQIENNTKVDHPSLALLELLKYVRLDELLELNIPFSSAYLPSEEVDLLLRKLGNNIRKLDLRASSLIDQEDVSEGIENPFKKFINLKELDIGFTTIRTLPLPHMFDNLEKLSLSSCSTLSEESLSKFLLEIPVSIRYLDLSRLDQIPFSSLWNLKVIHQIEGEERCVPTDLEEVKVVGIDHLTRRDVRSLKQWWETQRRDCIRLSFVEEREMEVNEVDWRKRDPRTPELVRPSLSTSEGRLSSSSSSQSSISSSSWDEIRTPPEFSPMRFRTSPSMVSRKFNLPNQHISLQSLSSSPSPHNLSQTPYTAPSNITSSRGRGRCKNEDEENEHQNISINIVHSAILESEDEDGYRRFIGEVVGGTLSLDEDLDGDQRELHPAHDSRRYVEVDL